MTNYNHTAEEVRKCAKHIDPHCDVAYEEMEAQASAMLTAYAALLERREAGVTDEVVERVLQSFYVGNVRKPWPWRESVDEAEMVFAGMRAALLAVWPVVAEPVAQDERVPDGWVLVPREPTTAMLEAGAVANGGNLFHAHVRAFYLAMLSAAPQPGEPVQPCNRNCDCMGPYKMEKSS